MPISHRLHGPMDVRPDEGINEQPKRIVFLSVEGNNTEKDYFNFIHKYRKQLGINALVHVETLSRFRRDGCSDPDKVYGLLSDYLQIRNQGILPVDVYEALSEQQLELSIEMAEKYLNGELPPEEEKKIDSALFFVGIDIDYQKYLRDYKGTDNDDVFAIVIDRDKRSHSEESLKKLILKCQENDICCLLSNPCFEFWLLLHLSDVQSEYNDRLDDLSENKKVSKRHTFVSYEVSRKAGHTKSINEKQFVNSYLNSVDEAIKRAKCFCNDVEGLLTEVGTNIPLLFSILREE